MGNSVMSDESKLRWSQDRDGAAACSCMHDDGDPFLYSFTRTEKGWRNDTAAELIWGPRLDVFTTLDSAKSWAQGVEDRWINSPDDDEPPPHPADGGER